MRCCGEYCDRCCCGYCGEEESSDDDEQRDWNVIGDESREYMTLQQRRREAVEDVLDSEAYGGFSRDKRGRRKPSVITDDIAALCAARMRYLCGYCGDDLHGTFDELGYENTVVRLQPCGHVFHRSCVLKYTESKAEAEENETDFLSITPMNQRDIQVPPRVLAVMRELRACRNRLGELKDKRKEAGGDACSDGEYPMEDSVVYRIEQRIEEEKEDLRELRDEQHCVWGDWGIAKLFEGERGTNGLEKGHFPCHKCKTPFHPRRDLQDLYIDAVPLDSKEKKAIIPAEAEDDEVSVEVKETLRLARMIRGMGEKLEKWNIEEDERKTAPRMSALIAHATGRCPAAGLGTRKEAMAVIKKMAWEWRRQCRKNTGALHDELGRLRDDVSAGFTRHALLKCISHFDAQMAKWTSYQNVMEGMVKSLPQPGDPVATIDALRSDLNTAEAEQQAAQERASLWQRKNHSDRAAWEAKQKQITEKAELDAENGWRGVVRGLEDEWRKAVAKEKDLAEATKYQCRLDVARAEENEAKMRNRLRSLEQEVEDLREEDEHAPSEPQGEDVAGLKAKIFQLRKENAALKLSKKPVGGRDMMHGTGFVTGKRHAPTAASMATPATKRRTTTRPDARGWNSTLAIASNDGYGSAGISARSAAESTPDPSSSSASTRGGVEDGMINLDSSDQEDAI